jgi:hypothetical protein
MDIEVKEASSILNNIQGDEEIKQRSQRKRKIQQSKYNNFLEFEEAIFGDILEEEEEIENHSEISEEQKKKPKTKKQKEKKQPKEPKENHKHKKKTFKVHKDNDNEMDQNIHDEDISLNEKEKIPRKKRTKIIEDESQNNIKEEIGPVINLSELNQKSSTFSNSEMILIILEICLNSKHYGINTSNVTRKFWDEVYEKEEWQNLLRTFKPETLRKYWRILRDTYDYKKIIETVHTYANDLNFLGVK